MWSSAFLLVGFVGASSKKVNEVIIPLPTQHPPILSTSDPVVLCPPGFTLDYHSRKCSQELVVPPEFSCEAGVLRDAMCHVFVPAQRICPPGYFNTGGACGRRQVERIVRSCPPGFVDNGHSCSRRIAAQLEEYCEEGVKEGGGCSILERCHAEHNIYCPPGFDEEDGQCCRIETYDCTPADSAPLNCEGDHCWDGQRDFYSRPFRNLHSKDKDGDIIVIPTPVFVEPEVWMPQYETPMSQYEPPRHIPARRPPTHRPVETVEQHVIIQQTCQKKVVRPMLQTPYCPGGWDLSGDRMCVRTTIRPTQFHCPALGDAGDCHRMESRRHEESCPVGYTLQGDECECQEEITPELSCPVSFLLNGGGCGRVFPAERVCDWASRMGEDGWCHRTEYAPLVVERTSKCIGPTCLPRTPLPVPVPISYSKKSKKMPISIPVVVGRGKDKKGKKL